MEEEHERSRCGGYYREIENLDEFLSDSDHDGMVDRRTDCLEVRGRGLIADAIAPDLSVRNHQETETASWKLTPY